MRHLTRALTASAALLAFSTSVRAQPEVHVAELVIACWPTNAHRFVETTFAPPNDALTVKFYFRAVTSPDFHFVEATTNLQGRAVAILPIADPQTTSIELFAELVTRSYMAYRTQPRIIPVMSREDCTDRDPAASWYQGQNADITVGSTRPGSPMPYGFRPDGISRFVGVTGAAEGEGGSHLPLILVGTGGAIGAGALILGGGSDDNTIGPPVGGGPTTTSTTPGGSSPTTSTPGSSTTLPGSTTSAPGSTTTAPGSTTTAPGTTTSTPGSTTTVPPTTTTSTPPTSTTSTPATVPSGTDISLSLSSTAPFMSGGSWYFSINGTVTNHGPGNATNILVTINVAGGLTSIGNNAGCGSGGTLVCVLGNISFGSSPKTFRVDFRADSPGSYTNNGIASLNQSDTKPSNNSANVTTIVTMLKAATTLPVTAQSTLLSPDGTAGSRGRVLVNAATSVTVEAGGETSMTLPLRAGRNHFIANADAENGGSWRFDFSATRGFIRLEVESGEVLAVDGHGVTFRLHPGVTEVRFSIDLEDESLQRR